MRTSQYTSRRKVILAAARGRILALGGIGDPESIPVSNPSRPSSHPHRFVVLLFNDHCPACGLHRRSIASALSPHSVHSHSSLLPLFLPHSAILTHQSSHSDAPRTPFLRHFLLVQESRASPRELILDLPSPPCLAFARLGLRRYRFSLVRCFWYSYYTDLGFNLH
jgi:hypothetical protein